MNIMETYLLDYKKRLFSVLISLYFRLLSVALIVETVMRVVLLLNDQTADVHFSFLDWVKIFFLGAINDAALFSLAYVLIALFLLTIYKTKTKGWVAIVHIALLSLFLVYLLFFNSVFKQYGGSASEIAIGVTLFWLASFLVRTAFPRILSHWRIVSLTFLISVYLLIIILNAIGEYCFWDEFGVRYNFIAVDYLIYTNEVIGNILESYPVFPITLGVVVSVFLIVKFFLWSNIKRVNECEQSDWRIKSLSFYAFLFVLALVLLPFNTRFQNSDNQYVNELQANSGYKFFEAFTNNELSYKKFYKKLTDRDADKLLMQFNAGNFQIGKAKPSKPNIVLITLESMSASNLSRFGSTDHLTPTLDSLYLHSVAFDSLFATGNRTVRGLEALSLSLPPSPGESRIRQKGNGKYVTVGERLSVLGYSSSFVYGGKSEFDNMRAFFEGNGYSIVDQYDFKPEEITFSNVWGTCDEDIYNKTLQVCNSRAKSAKPFFIHLMSVSNHRPFSFPTSYKTQLHGRDAGVAYSDYALGKFIKAAERMPWFKNTVFVIVADHCASSAGKVEMPLDKYHIPALVYAPVLVKPFVVKKVCSQIDLMPTVFDLFNLPFKSYYGKSVMNEGFHPRALIATYERLAYLDNHVMTILSPNCKYEQFRWLSSLANPYNLVPVDAKHINVPLLNQAVVFYQTADESRYVELK